MLPKRTNRGPTSAKTRMTACVTALGTALATVSLLGVGAPAVGAPAVGAPAVGAPAGATALPSPSPSPDTVGPGAEESPGADESPDATRSPTATANPGTVDNAPRSTVGGRLLAGRGVIVPADLKPLPKTEASAFLIADADTGAVLAAKDPHGHYRPASTLKTLTAVTLIPKLDKNRKVKPSDQACNVDGSAVGIVPEPIYKVDDLLRALLMVSANDAAVALAEANGGMRKTLADMNGVARRLQAYDTVAKTPNGLDKPGQRTSAYDLALIARAGLAMPRFREYIKTKVAKFPAPKLPKHYDREYREQSDGHNRGHSPKASKSPPSYYEMGNHNRLLWKYSGMIGVKNGWTSKALGSFVGAATRNGHTIIVVIMHHPGGFWDEVAKLLDWGFANRGKAAPIGRLVGPAAPSPSPSPSPSPGALPVRPGRPAASPAAAAGGAGGESSPLPAIVAVLAGGVLLIGGGATVYGIRRRRRESRT
ncbi:D-alanyl-D-alanine carboxypeptidase family protein [Sphaerimonospora thailandensis]|uniref:Putative penicillin-binding protein DacB1 n=1 Tax=Sphaerimonospora thailandensis TaxID=795644 RepID=A0A8J3VZF6_9ACTN|nr:D-alanyl-D-alanine carboxypeptidase [Sphaerimonospora thailandensis]GIH70427.1 putative penicillin-binding protein DacB1 [Sphaerimonospora thailandensis]